MKPEVAAAFKHLDWLDNAIRDLAYNCDCQEGGVDAMSIDTDWLRNNAEVIRAGLEAATTPNGDASRPNGAV